MTADTKARKVSGGELEAVEELRRLPILMMHFPSAPSVDFTDADQRMVIRCSCGVSFQHRDSSRVMEYWALHAMDAQAKCGGIPSAALQSAASNQEQGASGEVAK